MSDLGWLSIFAGVFDDLFGSHLVGRFLREAMISVSNGCVAWWLMEAIGRSC